MTEPLVPAEVDLRGLPFMPLDVNRLRDSVLAIESSGDEFRAAVLLWCASWGQVPAASLPDDDRALAAYAGYGRDLKGWKAVRVGAIRGFVKCSDGRLYHPVVAEKALEAWTERQEYRDRRENESERLRRYREEHKQVRARLREYGVTAAWDAKLDALRLHLAELDLRHGRTPTVGQPETEPETTPVQDPYNNRTEPEMRTGALPATAKTGTGTGKGLKERGADAPADKGHRLPADWRPSDDEIRWAEDERPDLNIKVEIEKFRDFWHSKPGKDGRRTSWSATWRNWVRNGRAAGNSQSRPAEPHRRTQQPL